MTNEEAIKLLSQIMDALLANNSLLPSTHNPIKESFGMAINALEKQIPQKAMESIDAYNKNLYKLYCPTCGALVANGNSRVGFMNKVSKGYDRCAACGQAIDWEGES